MRANINDGIPACYNTVLKYLNHHAPIKVRRIKTKRLPDWYIEKTEVTRRQRDHSRQRKLWTEKRRNKNKALIQKAKRKHFSDTVLNSKDTPTIWQHFRLVAQKANTTNNRFLRCIFTEDIASKLNEYFTSISDNINDNGTDASTSDLK